MNNVLAQIYGTSQEKTASEEGELDLNSITGQQLLDMLQAEEDEEKVASEDEEIDFSQFTGAELLEIMSQVDEEADAEVAEKTASALMEKMAADGSADYYDMAGRIMAHAYASEMGKVASEADEDPEELEVDLNAINGEQLMELMEAGYEFVDEDSEKVSSSAKAEAAEGLLDSAKNWLKRPGAEYRAHKGVGGKGRLEAALQTARDNKLQTAAALGTAGVGTAGVGTAGYKMTRRKDRD